MFKFIESDEPKKNVTNEYINELETKMNVKFPNILREYYLNHNCSKNKQCNFRIEGFDAEFNLDCIIPLKYGTMPLEKEYEYVLRNEALPNEFIPFAVDVEVDNYYWNTKDGKVYYISLSNVENPFIVCESVEKFFELLNRSCDEKITIPNLNNNKTENFHSIISLQKSKVPFDRVLKCKNKILSTSILVGVFIIIISLLLMPVSDGLSVIVAFACGVWILIFILVYLNNLIKSNKTLKMYDTNILKKELENSIILDEHTYLTDNFIISNSNMVCITRYIDIEWVFVEKAKGNVYSKVLVSSANTFSNTPILAYLKNGKKVVVARVKSSENMNIIFQMIKSKNNDVLIGDTPQNIEAYENINKNFKTKNKINSIMIFILLLLMIIGFIYVNFIK